MTVRIGKRRAASADRELQYESNDDPTLNRAAETTAVAALSLEEEEDENLSNDDGCVPTPANVGSTLVTYEYDLSIMPGVDKLRAVAQVDAHIPVRIAQELGIWCDDEEEQPMNRRALAEGADGIYKLTAGEPDVVRTDVQCEAKRFGFDCVPVKASLGVQYDADVTTAEQASEHLRHYISNLMEHEIIRTKNSQASYVGFDRPFDERPAYGGVGGSGGIVSSTIDRSGESSNSGGMSVVGVSLLSVFSVLGVLLAFLVLKRRRDNHQEPDEVEKDTDDALAPVSEKPLEISRSGSDGTLEVDMDFSQSFEAAAAEAEAEAEAASIVEDIQRTRSSASASPGRTPLPVVHEDFDPSFESEV